MPRIDAMHSKDNMPGPEKPNLPSIADTDAHDYRDEDEPSLSEDGAICLLLFSCSPLSILIRERLQKSLCNEQKGDSPTRRTRRSLWQNYVAKKLLKSRHGRGGGYWLTPEGKRRAKRLSEQNSSIA